MINVNIQALEVRQQLFEFIQKFPGLHFREIQRRTGMSVGALQYHLRQLQGEKLVVGVKYGEYTHYYPVGAVTEADKFLLPFLRQKPIRRMLVYLLENKKANNKALCKVSGVSPATTSWYLSKLLSAGIVSKLKQGREMFYSVVKEKDVARTLVSYKASFLDRVVERFTEIWER
ncbi:MAG: winged helix-turn-helix transcriptional regulator [Candidatus ainarchaeum sp.]|nr:winged helix-turn-helix transcriptional regulator [Candidatus ainarchaeum sp.]